MANWIGYGLGVKEQWGTTAARRVDFTGDTIKAMLLNSSYTPNQDTHDFVDDVNANEVSGTGYTAGGLALSGKSVSYDGTSNEVRFLFADLVWGPGATISGIRACVIYKDTGSAATSPLIAYHLDTADRAVSAGTFTLDVDTTTCWKITMSAT